MDGCSSIITLPEMVVAEWQKADIVILHLRVQSPLAHPSLQQFLSAKKELRCTLKPATSTPKRVAELQSLYIKTGNGAETENHLTHAR